VRIAFVHYPGRVARLEAARAGEAPSEFLFGAVELERQGHEIEHFEVDPAMPRGPASLVDRGSRRGLLPPHLGGSTLFAVRALLPRLRQADVVVGSTTGTAMALAVWRLLGRHDRPLVGIVAGLANRRWRPTRLRTTLPLLRRMHVLLYGDGELEPVLALDPRLQGRVHVDRFGVDTGFWSPAEVAPEGFVMAIGNDGNRDWQTLVAAAAEIPADVRIFTHRQPPSGLPANVVWHDADWYTQVLSDAEVRDLYRRASAVIVPIRDVPQPSGQSVALQAMACGRPVVLSRTRGLWAPETLHEDEDVLLVPPGDPGALAAAARRLLEDERLAGSIGAAARASVLRGAAVDGFAARLLEICRAAIESP
jgi:glycosyltransferase involved in cell wall biosynthesis